MGDSGDSWGRDPAVQRTRRVFKRMEADQSVFLDALGIRAFDPRLRPWRREALVLLERSWAEARRGGIPLDEERAGTLYLYCLAERLNRSGLDVSKGRLPVDPEVENLFRKVAS